VRGKGRALKEGISWKVNEELADHFAGKNGCIGTRVKHREASDRQLS
jgi:hypothetical protein